MFRVEESFPQGRSPVVLLPHYGMAEAMPLQSKSRADPLHGNCPIDGAVAGILLRPAVDGSRGLSKI